MELRHFRYFVTVAEEMHFARAAERLNIAPPTLTVQIQEIERSLSVQLFVRTKRSVALTSAGELFLEEARLVLDQYARAESVGRRAGRGEVGRIEIGYVGSAAYAGVLQNQIAQFSNRWTDVDIRASELPMDEVPRLIESGQIDIGVVRLPIKHPRSIHSHILLQDHFCLALQSGHRLAEPNRQINAAELAGETFIMPEQEYGTYEIARRGRFPPNIVSRPGSLLSVLTQVSLGAGVSVIPSSITNTVHLPNVTFCHFGGKRIASEVAALFRSDEAAHATRNFIRQIRESIAMDPDIGLDKQ